MNVFNPASVYKAMSLSIVFSHTCARVLQIVYDGSINMTTPDASQQLAAFCRDSTTTCHGEQQTNI